MKRIVLFVEGEGEANAVPHLVAKLLTEQSGWDAVFVDQHPFRVGEVNRLVKEDYREWKRKIGASLKRSDVGGILLLLDGDIKRVGNAPFCAANVACALAEEAKTVGGGSTFSVAIVFARQEYESWLIAGIESLKGKTFPDGRLFPEDIVPPSGNLEESPRDAKGWLRQAIPGGYRPTRDQSTLTQWLDPQAVRARKIRSFHRLDSAISELISAIREEDHVVTPSALNHD